MSLGLDPDSFWTKTPRLISVVIDGKAVQLRREHNARAWLAYYTAALSRTRQPISLRKLQVPEDRSPVRQTPEQQFAIFKALAVASKVLRKH